MSWKHLNSSRRQLCFYLESFLMSLSIRHFRGAPTPEQEEGWGTCCPCCPSPYAPCTCARADHQYREKKTGETITYFRSKLK